MSVQPGAPGVDGEPTPSAVSRRIQTLEGELSTPLFTRFTRRLELTAAGAQFLDATGRGIYLIEEATAAVRPRRHGRVVRLSTAQYLASTWLLPQLAVLRRRRPDIDIRIETSAELVDLIEGEYNAAIRSGEGRWPGLGKQQFIASLLKAFSESLPCVVALGLVQAARDC